jgi:hypothetical protein
MARVRANGKRDEETQIETEMRQRLGCSCPEMHTNERRENLGHSCLLFSKAGLGIYIESKGKSVAIYYTLRREREKGAESDTKSKLKLRVLPATERSIVCEESPVFR